MWFRRNRRFLLALAAATAILLLDCFAPTGYVEWVLYVIPLYISYDPERPYLTFLMLGLVALYLLVGLVISRPEDWGVSLFNRGLGFWSMVIFTIVINNLIQTSKNLNHERELLQQRTRELAYSNQEMESFAYSVSHDLRAPLRAIRGFGDILLEDYGDKLDETGRECMERILSGADQMEVLIGDMLSLSNVSRQNLTFNRVNLSTIATHIVDELRRMEPEREVEFIVPAELHAQADNGLIQIALTNLLSNAWKFSAVRQPARIELNQMIKDKQPVFFVRDNGVGFNNPVAAKLFEPFRRMHTDGEFPGTGIGLAIVDRVIRRHGGQVWAEGEPDAGATFYFTLPNQQL